MSDNNRPNSTTLALRAVVLLYVLYLAYGVAEGYLKGEPDALPLPATIAAVSVMVIGAGVLLFLTWKQWMQSKSGSSAETEDGE